MAAVVAGLALVAFFLGYRFYARFIGARIFRDHEEITTPAHELEDGRDFVQVIAVSPRGGGLLQRAGATPGGHEIPLPEGWSLRTEALESRTTIHLPNPTLAWFFASGASFQGPVDTFGASAALGA